MLKLVSKPEYEEQLAASRDKRMEWWRSARFGMFIHFGLYTVLQRHEWAMALEEWHTSDYEKLADRFNPSPGAPREWAKLARDAGMKYMVLTTRHHEGFSLWDSKVNPYNSMNYGCKRDIVREYVDACREFGLKVGLYSTMVDWHHPDSGAAAYDSAARKKFNDYTLALNKELLTNYGKIDILWYDTPVPMETHEGWNSLEMNQNLRTLQPDIIINDRSYLKEDFGTPEGQLTVDSARDWEACMSLNGICWGYIDSAQAEAYSCNAQRIIKMLQTCAGGCGNLLLNIGPAPDGSVPAEAIKPLNTVGKWLEKHGECVYGKLKPSLPDFRASGVCGRSRKENTVYMWNWIWPDDGEMIFGGYTGKLKSVRLLGSDIELPFTQEKYRIILRDLPKKTPDDIAGIAVIALEFEEDPAHVAFAGRPQYNQGRVYEE